MPKVLKDFLLMLLNELIDCLFLLLATLIMVIKRFKETAIESDADPRATQQIEFYRMLNTNSQVFTVKKIKKKPY